MRQIYKLFAAIMRCYFIFFTAMNTKSDKLPKCNQGSTTIAHNDRIMGIYICEHLESTRTTTN